MFVVCVHVPVGINDANSLSVEGLPDWIRNVGKFHSYGVVKATEMKRYLEPQTDEMDFINGPVWKISGCVAITP